MSHVLHVTCHTCYMSQISTNKNLTKDPMCHIFLESSCKIQFNGHDENIACHMCYMSHVTNINLQTILPMTQCVIYFWEAHAKYGSIIITKKYKNKGSVISGLLYGIYVLDIHNQMHRINHPSHYEYINCPKPNINTFVDDTFGILSVDKNKSQEL